MFERAVLLSPSFLQPNPDHFKLQEICDKVVRYDPFSLQFVPDWFVTREEVDMWFDKYYADDFDYCFTEGDDDDKFFEWYDRYKKR